MKRRWMTHVLLAVRLLGAGIFLTQPLEEWTSHYFGLRMPFALCDGIIVARGLLRSPVTAG